MQTETRQRPVLFTSRLLAAAVLACLFLPLLTFSATLADYRKRLEQARAGTDELHLSLDDKDAETELETRVEIEKLVPASEKIEWPAGSVETDNAWLAKRLKDFEQETDEDARGAILIEISERLSGMSASIKELETAIGSSTSKDEGKQKIAEILRREEYQKPEPKQQSLLQRWLNAFLEWLASVFPGRGAPVSGGSDFGAFSVVLQAVLFLLVLGLIGFSIYKIAPGMFRRFGPRPGKDKKDRVILGERVGADDSASDLFSEAEVLARQGNLRGAIRKGYIAMLCDLSDRKIVRLAGHKTNRDYLRDVRKNRPLFDDMTGLTRNFERNWYGLRAAEQSDWEEFRSAYRQMLETAKSGGI